MKRIAVFPGGGMRALVQAPVCSAIEQITGKKFSAVFDLMAGTSAGAIAALALGAGKRPDALSQFFTERASRIFARRWYGALAPHLGLLFASKYRASGIERELQAMFGDRRLGDLRTRVMIPAFDIATGEPKMFKSWTDPHERTWEVARASSAAPTYFPPFRNRIDGGLTFNDPGIAAIHEARLLWPNEPLAMLVIGNGGSGPKPLRLRSQGFFGWAPKIVPALMGAADRAFNYLIETNPPYKFVHLDPDTLLGASLALDDASPANLSRLSAAGEKLAADSAGLIRNFLSE